MRRQSNIRSFDDLRNARRQIIIAGSGSTPRQFGHARGAAKYENLPIKVVRGYPGIIDAILAVERGEADGVFCQRASIRSDMLASAPWCPCSRSSTWSPTCRSSIGTSATEGEGAARASERARNGSGSP